MKYNRLKDLLLSVQNADSSLVFDLMPTSVKSKIIYTVGKGATNTAAYLSAIMSEYGIEHSRAICSRYIEPKDRFLCRGTPIPMKKLLLCTDKYNRQLCELSADALYFLLALDLLDIGGKYLIFELTHELYRDIALKLPFSAEAVIFCDADGEMNVGKATREVIALTNDEDFDYISSKSDKNGVRISFVSPNKIDILRSGLLGTSFYYNSLPYRGRMIDQNNVPLACLSIECASLLFDVPRLSVSRAIENASPELDAVLYSLSPTVLLKLGETDIKLPRGKNYKMITEFEPFAELETDNGIIFCGSKNFLEQVKKKICSEKKNRQASR